MKDLQSESRLFRCFVLLTAIETSSKSTNQEEPILQTGNAGWQLKAAKPEKFLKFTMHVYLGRRNVRIFAPSDIDGR